MHPFLPTAFFGFPVVVWVAAYLLLAWEFGKWNLVSVKIHETGRYSLLETIFYYNHFLRELPIDTLFVFAMVWSWSAAGIRIPGAGDRPYLPAFLLGAFLLVVFMGSLRTVGMKSTLMDLFQLRERDDLVKWGSHWQMHFLSTAALLALFILPGLVYSCDAPHLPAPNLLIGVFLGLSLVFGTGFRAVANRRWVLHGGREILTYFLLVMIPGFAPFFLRQPPVKIYPGPWSILLVCFLLVVCAYEAYVFFTSSLDDEAQSRRGVAYLLSSHFFEHVLDLVYMGLLIMALGPAWSA